jgi:short-subunit dehydrogenase
MNDKNSKGAALITGASSGIGAVYADRLAKRGYDLILAARDAARLETLAARLRAEAGVAVEVVPTDLTVPDDLQRLETRLRDDANIALLLNNAGAGLATPFADCSGEVCRNLIQLNITAVTCLAAAAAASFKRQGRGAIINLGSIVGLIPALKSTVYGATKAYVLYLSESMNDELAGSGVTVQAVLPGATRTEIWARMDYAIENLPDEALMDAEEMVDAALAGLDQGELVTIPSLPDPADWAAVLAARVNLGPKLSAKHAAGRYRVKTAEPV